MQRTLDDSTLNEYAAKLKTFARVTIASFALLIAFAYAAPAQSQTLDFTVQTTTSNGTSIVPRLSWTTTPTGAVCTATTVPAAVAPATDPFSGSKPASGTNLLPAITATHSYTLSCNWPGVSTAVVTWGAPTTNTDGSLYTNPGGYRIQYGKAADALDTSVYLQDPTALTWTSPSLAAGTWYFGVRAFNAQGLESALSNVGSKVLTTVSNQTRTLDVAVRFPNAASGVTVR